jgi:GNAT superfamily N-acetyltransferase
VFADLPTSESKGLPAIDIPVVLLGRLAVDRAVQSRGLGAALLVDALKRILLHADEIGIRAVEVHAIDGTAKKFYLKYGFRELLDDSQHLFMPLHEIRKLNFDG